MPRYALPTKVARRAQRVCGAVAFMECCGWNMPVIVKICGITNVEDALAAARFGADALGFVFHPASPRAVDVEAAARIAQKLPIHIVRVGVFVDTPDEVVFSAIARCGLNLLQFHGQETPEYCLQFGVMSMKAFRVKDQTSLHELPNYGTDAWLLDSYVADKLGGTGEKFNWDLARQASSLGRPIFLAGGLTSENVGEAIRAARPYAVDVSSGVEAAPGKKDLAKVHGFIKAAKTAAE
jgi:phosphoribosylanthranilate isomerase